jgi:hypothetical protein
MLCRGGEKSDAHSSTIDTDGVLAWMRVRLGWGEWYVC